MKRNKLFLLGILVVLVGVGLLTVNALNDNTKTKNVSLLKDQEILIKYSETKTYDNKKFEIYLDENENEYIFLDNNLTGYLKNVKITEEESSKIKKTMEDKDLRSKKLEEYKTNALEILGNAIKGKTTLDKYDLIDIYYQESYDELVYSFRKTIDGYKTNDSITVSLDTNGNLSSLNTSRQGLFDKYDNLKIDRSKVEEFIKTSMDSYKNVTNYKVNYELINFVNNKLVLEIGIELRLEVGAFSTTVLYYEI